MRPGIGEMIQRARFLITCVMRLGLIYSHAMGLLTFGSTFDEGPVAFCRVGGSTDVNCPPM
eukprot:3570428-Alexandrium_andersonii.AAC.1